MQHPTLPASLALAFLAAAASAQTVPVKTRNAAAEQFSVGVSYATCGDVGGLNIDTSGTTLDVRAALSGNVFLTASYSDLSIDDLGPVSFDPSAYSIGVGARFAAGNGTIELSYAFRSVDLSPSIAVPIFTGSFDQHWVRLGYSLELGNGLSFGLAASQIFNTETDVDDVTAVEASLAVAFGKGFSANLSYATEDMVLGEKDGGGTTSIGLRYGF